MPPNDYLFRLWSDQFFEFCDTGFPRNNHHVRLAHRHRQVAELGQIELHCRIGKKLFQMIGPEMLPITVPSFGACVERVIRGDNAAGARHVVYNDGGIAGNIFG